MQLTDAYLQRDGDGNYPNLMEANAAVINVDSSCSKEPDFYRELGDEFAEQAPTFGRFASTLGLVCAYWDVEPDPLETPTGAGARFEPPRYLKPGDVIEVEADGIGTLRNGVVDEAP